MKTIVGQFLYPDGSPIANGVMTLQLSQDASTGEGKVAPTILYVSLDEQGSFSVSLFGNDELSPSGTYYTITVYANGRLVYGSEAYNLSGTSPVNLDALTPVKP